MSAPTVTVSSPSRSKKFCPLPETLPSASEFSLPGIQSLYPDLAERIFHDIFHGKWMKEERFARATWSKLMKKTQGPVGRLLKELNELLPVIDRILKKVDSCAEMEDCDGTDNERSKKFTIVDIGCGMGILGMILADLLPPEKVERIVLVDKMWEGYGVNSSTATGTEGGTPEDDLEIQQEEEGPIKMEVEGNNDDIDDGRDEEEDGFPDHVNEDDDEDTIEGAAVDGDQQGARKKKSGPQQIKDHIPRRHIEQCDWPIPLRILRVDLKRGRSLVDLVHFVFNNGDKHSRKLIKNDGENTSLLIDNVNDIQNNSTTTSYLYPSPNRVLLTGVHLCGSLSLRAVDLFNRNPHTVELLVLKPCCLPGRIHLRGDMEYTVGARTFSVRDMYREADYNSSETASAAASSSNNIHNRVRGGGGRKFRSWCKQVYECIEVGDGGSAGGDRKQHLSIKVYPLYFQDQFLIAEREMRPIDGGLSLESAIHGACGRVMTTATDRKRAAAALLSKQKQGKADNATVST